MESQVNHGYFGVFGTDVLHAGANGIGYLSLVHPHPQLDVSHAEMVFEIKQRVIYIRNGKGIVVFVIVEGDAESRILWDIAQSNTAPEPFVPHHDGFFVTAARRVVGIAARRAFLHACFSLLVGLRGGCFLVVFASLRFAAAALTVQLICFQGSVEVHGADWIVESRIGWVGAAAVCLGREKGVFVEVGGDRDVVDWLGGCLHLLF